MRTIRRLISAGLIAGILFPGLVILCRCLPLGVPLAGHDFLFQFEPWWEFTRESIRSARLPWWDASVMLGYPLLADPQSALFYPPNWLMLLAPVGPTLAILTGSHLALIGLFTACWMRSRGACLPAAMFSGMAISSTGFLFSHVGAGHYTLICAAAWTRQCCGNWTDSGKHHPTGQSWERVSAGVSSSWPDIRKSLCSPHWQLRYGSDATEGSAPAGFPCGIGSVRFS